MMLPGGEASIMCIPVPPADTTRDTVTPLINACLQHILRRCPLCPAKSTQLLCHTPSKMPNANTLLLHAQLYLLAILAGELE